MDLFILYNWYVVCKMCMWVCDGTHTVRTTYFGNHQTLITRLLDSGSSDNRVTHKSCTNHYSLTSTDKSDGNNKPPLRFLPLSSCKFRLRMNVCVGVCKFMCLCVCMPASEALCVSGSEKLISTQAVSKWVKKTERETEMHACVRVQVRSVQCFEQQQITMQAVFSDTIVSVGGWDWSDKESDFPAVPSCLSLSWEVYTTLIPLSWVGDPFWLWFSSSVQLGAVTQRDILN